jgi:hypothetical protein
MTIKPLSTINKTHQLPAWVGSFVYIGVFRSTSAKEALVYLYIPPFKNGGPIPLHFWCAVMEATSFTNSGASFARLSLICSRNNKLSKYSGYAIGLTRQDW